MKRILFYILKYIAFALRIFSNSVYMTFIKKAHQIQKVTFDGNPEYIDYNAHLDASGGLTISEGVVISTHVIILTHDWSFLKRLHKKNMSAFSPVVIKENSFIGAGAIILPGTCIGKSCIIGAGAVVKGVVNDFSIIAGNPAKIVGRTDS